MSCSRTRRELLEHFALGEELGSSSVPHLDHLATCADCRREVGIDRALVKNLRRALVERVDGCAPSEASWSLVRSRTVDQPMRPWTLRVAHWGGMLSAGAAAGIMLFAVATAPESRIFSDTQSPFAAARRAVPPVEEAGDLASVQQRTYVAPQTDAPLPGQRMQLKIAGSTGPTDNEPPITGRMR